MIYFKKVFNNYVFYLFNWAGPSLIFCIYEDKKYRIKYAKKKTFVFGKYINFRFHRISITVCLPMNSEELDQTIDSSRGVNDARTNQRTSSYVEET